MVDAHGRQPIGSLLDALGVGCDLDDGEHVTDAVVLLRVSPIDAEHSRIAVVSSDGMDWITQLGLIHAARSMAEYDPSRERDL